ERNGQIMTSENLVGPYKIQGKSIYSGLAPNLEDPVLWYSGGYYHVVVNSWSEKKAFHLRSKNGISGWTNEGVAFDPRSDFLRYTDGTVNHWCKIERPGVFIQNGHITHWTFAVIDSEKEDDLGNDDHNSKVIVVPFDGVAFDGEIVPENRDTVYNGKFDVGTAGWTLNVWEGTATGTVTNGEYSAAVSEKGTENYSVQLIQSGLILKRDKYYKVSFSAHASVNRPLEVNVEMNDDPWTSYLAAPNEFDLTTSKEPYSFTFKMENPTDSTGRLSFNMGGATGTVFLDDISIVEDDGTSTKHSVSKIAYSVPVVNCMGSVLKIRVNSGIGKQMTVGIYDLNGNFRKIAAKKYSSDGQQVLVSDISSFPKGMYVVGLSCDGKVIHRAKFLNH
ncbi:MAG: carbohydrate binding domain-containing protein, partial [Fibrobacter sp.]|nr:carbohydrate binding domain-containing protein [Fibrobacter sp.]